jgi:pimeloyl-ACP methyl ester carboxylesterase
MSDDELDHNTDDQISRRVVLGRIAGAGVVAAAASAALGGSNALARQLATSTATTAPTEGATVSEPETTPPTPTPGPATAGPTVVLVHGSFADASGWAGVIPILQAAGLNVMAPVNPLRGLTADTAYIASFVSQIEGPVLLGAHSYGGAVITNAASQVDNVVGLVYVSAFIPDEGETIGDLAAQATDSLLGPALRPLQYPTDSGEPGTEFYIDPASFHEVFCADLPAEQAAVMAVSQRPGADVGFAEPTTNPAWKTLPAWAVVGTADNAIGPTGAALMAQRSGAEVTEIDASHVVMMSQPQAVADVILTAATAVGAGSTPTESSEPAAPATT